MTWVVSSLRLASILTLVSLGSLCSQVPVSTSNSLLMPDGLENVRLGMTKDELITTRPSLKQDDSRRGEDYIETGPVNDFFSFVDYEFVGGKLSKLTLSESGDTSKTRNRCAGLFTGSINKWGADYSRLVGVIENHPVTHETYLYPVLYWRKPDANILVRCVVTSDVKNAPNFYSLTIFASTLKLNQAIQLDLKNSLTPAEEANVFKDVLGQPPKGPVFR